MDKAQRKEIAVVGGGIIGLATARELSRYEYSVTLFEKGKIHAATSANSHRIIHGGLRYLQALDLKRVSRSLRAKSEALKEFQGNVVPLKCSLVLSGKGLKRPITVGIAGAMYGAAAALFGQPLEWTGLVPLEEFKKSHEFFSGLSGKKVFQWKDARMRDPSEVAKKIRDDFERNGGAVLENTEIVEVSARDGTYHLISREGENYTAQGVVFALGPWCNGVGGAPQLAVHSWAKAFNLVFRREIVADEAVGFAVERGQVLFAAPRKDQLSAIGTWYSPFSGNPSEAAITEDEVSKALLEVTSALGLKKPLTREDIEQIEVGVLPCRGFGKSGEPNFYGSEIYSKSGKLLSVLSTKYTTFPVVAEEILHFFEKEFLFG